MQKMLMMSLDPTQTESQAWSGDEQTKFGFVVLNPVSGNGEPERIRSLLEAELEEGTYEVYETTGEEDLAEVVATAVSKTNYAWVAAIGGDGTVSLVANGLVESDIPLIIIPNGTSNALSKELSIPQKGKLALRLLDNFDNVRSLDGMKINEQYYFYQIGVGLESVAIDNTTAESKNKLGTLAYLWTGAKELIGWKLDQFQIEIDDKRHQLQASDIIVANSGVFGAMGLDWNEEIVPDDGRIDIAIVQAKTWRHYLAVLWSLLRRRPYQNKNLQFFQAKRSIRLNGAKQLPIHGDGETIDQPFPLDITIIPEAITVIVPMETQ